MKLHDRLRRAMAWALAVLLLSAHCHVPAAAEALPNAVPEAVEVEAAELFADPDQDVDAAADVLLAAPAEAAVRELAAFELFAGEDGEEPVCAIDESWALPDLDGSDVDDDVDNVGGSTDAEDDADAAANDEAGLDDGGSDGAGDIGNDDVDPDDVENIDADGDADGTGDPDSENDPGETDDADDEVGKGETDDAGDESGKGETDDADDADGENSNGEDTDVEDTDGDEGGDPDALLGLAGADEAPAPLRLSATSLKLGLKERRTLGVELSPPEGETAEPLRFKSSKPSVVSVSAGGVLKGRKRGRAVITVSAGAYSAQCTVKVCKAPKKVRFTSKKLSIGLDEARKLGVRLPSGSASQLRFSSSDQSIVQVDADGLVTGVSTGSATITVRTFNKKKATCKVTVKAAPQSVTVSPEMLTLGVGQSGAVKASVNAGSAGAIKLISGDPAVASASGFNVKGVSVGETTVNAAAYNGANKDMVVRVLPAPTYVSFGKKTIYIGRGERLQLKPVIDEGSHTAFKYKSKDKYQVSVSSKGVIKGLHRGRTVITVTTHNGLKASVTIRVTNAPRKVKFVPASLTLALEESRKLKVKLSSNSASALRFTSSDPDVVTVDEEGIATAVGPGSATITVRTFNDKKARCVITVGRPDVMPEPPRDVTVEATGPSSAVVSWSAGAQAEGYRVYVGSSPSSMELYGDYPATARQAVLRGLTPGETLYICVTAQNVCGETLREGEVTVTQPEPEAGDDREIRFNYDGPILLRVGSTREITATLSPEGDLSGLSWESTAPAIAAITAGGSRCVVTAQKPGTATVSATLDGASARMTVMVVDITDGSAENLNRVQQAVARHDQLMDEANGDDVIWQLIAGALRSVDVLESRVNEIISRVKGAGDSFRDLYVFSFGSYAIDGDATTDKNGAAISASQFLPRDNTVYLPRSSLSNAGYAYVLLHESGHAIDYNAQGDNALESQNDDAYDALMTDVRAILNGRIADAADDAGVVLDEIDGDAVIDALLNYRALLNYDEVVGALSEDEQKVYQCLVDNVKNEIDGDGRYVGLPKNNGIMVWDALEGATNFAISGSYGHSYIFNIPAYANVANYYYYNRKGEPRITTEPWAEYVSAGLMGDADTISVNESYLPTLCTYFAENLLPSAIEWFRTKLLGN